ncbi:MAG TPA: DUF2628 domain-containing protein [Stellaceae bacterium]|nr:DUF2628 domain-containing protein [Stellaceae bacterium]
MASTATIRDIFEQSDQGQVRADLTAFFGPQGGEYLRVYDKMRRDSKIWVWSWSWPGFFAPIAWMFYRRLYLYGAICVLIPVVATLVFGAADGGIGFAIVAALSVKAWYVSAGLRRIAEADRLELQGDERRDYLRHMGGVSPAAGWLVGLLQLLLLMYLVSQTFADALGSKGNF